MTPPAPETESRAIQVLYEHIKESQEELQKVKTDMGLFAANIDHALKDNLDFKNDIKNKLNEFLQKFDEKIESLPCLNPRLAEDSLPWYVRTIMVQMKLQWALLSVVAVAIIVELFKK